MHKQGFFFNGIWTYGLKPAYSYFRNAYDDSNEHKLRVAGDLVSKGLSPITGESARSNLDIMASGDAQAAKRWENDKTFRDMQETLAKMRTKAYAGWVRTPDGKWKNAPDKINAVTDQISKLEGAHNSPGKQPILNTDPIRKGIGKGFKESIGAGDVINNPRGAFKLYAKSKGWGDWANKFADDPVLFWGGITAGTIGIAALVKAFLGSRKGQQGVVNNYYYNGATTGAPGMFPTTTSYWRA